MIKLLLLSWFISSVASGSGLLDIQEAIVERELDQLQVGDGVEGSFFEALLSEAPEKECSENPPDKKKKPKYEVVILLVTGK